METKNKYESARVELIYINSADVITTSQVLGTDSDSEGPVYDTGGWT